MKKSINSWEFQDAFKQMGREDNFSYDGLKALHTYFEDLEEDCDIEIELDVIAICCEYTEYEDLEEFQGQYGEDFKTIESIYDHTQVIMINDTSFIIQAF